MNFCYLPDGRCIRAEFAKQGSKVYEFPPAVAAEGYRSGCEEILGIPDQGPNISVTDLLSRLRISDEIEKVTRLNITYVTLRHGGTPARPVFIVNVWGVRDSFFRDQNLERLRKSRYVFDDAGNVLFFDNTL